MTEETMTLVQQLKLVGACILLIAAWVYGNWVTRQDDNIVLSSRLIRAIIISQMNTHIWYNESKAREGNGQDTSLLRLTHGLNGIRNTASNYILHLINTPNRRDYKTDCLAAEFKDWQVSL